MQGGITSPGVSSPRCAPFCGAGAPRTRRRRPPSSSAGQGGGCGRPLDRVASWVGGGIAAAFFASLERCSCVNVRTHDELDDEMRDSEAPLIVCDDGNVVNSVAGERRRRRGSRRNERSTRSGGGK
uniref:Uncharacterized protein n=1 Tax=Leersia perrieri TaxID=77586 RepID=A0A0D9VXC5_9ORYZ